MPSFKLLITHLCFMLQMPVRLYDSDSTLVMQGDSDGEQEDPLVCDPDFAGDLLVMRNSEQPVLHLEQDLFVYAVIPAENDQTVVMGPFCYMQAEKKSLQTMAKSHHLKHPQACRVTFLPLEYALESVLLLFHAYSDRPLSRADLTMQLMKEEDYTEPARSDAFSRIYQLRETNSAHNSYAQELREQKAVREGNVEALRESWAEIQTGQLGRLGRDDVTHYRNLSVVVLTLASRSAMEGGVLPEVAYSLADAYTMKISEMRDIAGMSKLIRSAEIHFAELVQRAAVGNQSNPHVARCKQLIHDRLHQRISVEELAREMGLSRSYLSGLFQEQEGLSLSSYILRAKVRSSEYLLMRPDVSLEQIAATFAFSSQSHYGQVFKRFNGITPGAYREIHSKHK